MNKFYRMLQLLVCVGLLTTFIGCTSTAKHESAGQYVDDSVITTKVKAAIFNETKLKSFQINVKTMHQVVQLSGFVDSAQTIAQAGEVARAVEGVVSVDNALLIK